MRKLPAKTMTAAPAVTASTAVAAEVCNTGRLATLSLAQCLAAGRQYGYGVTYLDAPGGSSSYANDINDAGQVALTAAEASGNARAFVYDQARGMVDLGTLGGSAYRGPYDLPSETLIAMGRSRMVCRCLSLGCPATVSPLA